MGGGGGVKVNDFLYKESISKIMKQEMSQYVTNAPRRSLIMTLIPGCDLEHSQGTLILGVGTQLLCVKHLVEMI